jgi:hypothetical protein
MEKRAEGSTETAPTRTDRAATGVRLGLLLLTITSLRVKTPAIRGVASHGNRSRDSSGG